VTTFNSECWTKESDIHGFGGIPQNKTTLEQCQAACINYSTCVAIDWEPTNPVENTCWLLTSILFGNTLETGVITHYKLNRLCLSKFYFHFYLRHTFSQLLFYSNDRGGIRYLICVI